MAYDVNQIININVRISPQGLSLANFASYTLFAPQSEVKAGLTPAFSPDTRRVYNSISDVAVDFAENTETYMAASKVLGGIPNTSQITIYLVATSDATRTATLNKAIDTGWWFWTLWTAPILANAANVLQIAEWCNQQGIMFVNNQTGANATAIRNPALTNDIASQLNQAGYRTTFTFTHATDGYAGNALTKYFAAINFSAQNSTITGEYKKLSGVVAEDLSATAHSAMEAKNAMWYGSVNLQGSTDLGRVFNTRTHSAFGEWLDDVVNLAAFTNSLQVTLYNTIANSTSKLGQDMVGQEILIGQSRTVGEQYILNGFLGERIYTDPIDAQEKYTRGYEILTKPEDILRISDEDRANRLAAPIIMQIFRRGAIHAVRVTVDVF